MEEVYVYYQDNKVCIEFCAHESEEGPVNGVNKRILMTPHVQIHHSPIDAKSENLNNTEICLTKENISEDPEEENSEDTDLSFDLSEESSEEDNELRTHIPEDNSSLEDISEQSWTFMRPEGVLPRISESHESDEDYNDEGTSVLNAQNIKHRSPSKSGINFQNNVIEEEEACDSDVTRTTESSSEESAEETSYVTGSSEEKQPNSIMDYHDSDHKHANSSDSEDSETGTYCGSDDELKQSNEVEINSTNSTLTKMSFTKEIGVQTIEDFDFTTIHSNYYSYVSDSDSGITRMGSKHSYSSNEPNCTQFKDAYSPKDDHESLNESGATTCDDSSSEFSDSESSSETDLEDITSIATLKKIGRRNSKRTQDFKTLPENLPTNRFPTRQVNTIEKVSPCEQPTKKEPKKPYRGLQLSLRDPQKDASRNSGYTRKPIHISKIFRKMCLEQHTKGSRKIGLGHSNVNIY